jgi:LPXTG-motif cell wall-anchored protein
MITENRARTISQIGGIFALALVAALAYLLIKRRKDK